MEIKHTSNPWQVNEGVDGAWFIWNQKGGIDTENLIMCCAGRVNSDHRDPLVAAADAAFIVRACNAHDDLVAKGKRLLNELTHINPPTNAILNAAYLEFEAALAKAEARQ